MNPSLLLAGFILITTISLAPALHHLGPTGILWGENFFAFWLIWRNLP